jgi:hypothetical protein
MIIKLIYIADLIKFECVLLMLREVPAVDWSARRRLLREKRDR